MSEELEPGRGEPTVGWDPRKLRDLEWHELAIRFAFGAGVSTVAALIGTAFGAAMGGMFLAFPAILPATLTLLEQKHGTDDAVHDDRGALLGSFGLVAFAVVAAELFTRTTTAAVIAAATAAWIVVAVGTYLAVAAWRQARDERREQRRDVTSALHGRVSGCQMR